MHIEVEVPRGPGGERAGASYGGGGDGETVSFECENSITSAWVCREILEGTTYPVPSFLGDVAVVLDVGANCGAAAIHFARAFPAAAVHAFEPAAAPREVAERNAAAYPNVTVHPFGLSDQDAEARLFHADESIMGSIVRTDDAVSSEPVHLRRGDTWALEAGIDRVDVLKVDVEGAEQQVLVGLGDLVDRAQVVYVEYDSRRSRRWIEGRLAGTHELYFASLQVLDQGEAMYLRSDLCDHPDALEELRVILRRRYGRPVEG